jgi:hypothetical protein
MQWVMGYSTGCDTRRCQNTSSSSGIAHSSLTMEITGASTNVYGCTCIMAARKGLLPLGGLQGTKTTLINARNLAGMVPLYDTVHDQRLHVLYRTDWC